MLLSRTFQNYNLEIFQIGECAPGAPALDPPLYDILIGIGILLLNFGAKYLVLCYGKLHVKFIFRAYDIIYTGPS